MINIEFGKMLGQLSKESRTRSLTRTLNDVHEIIAQDVLSEFSPFIPRGCWQPWHLLPCCFHLRRQWLSYWCGQCGSYTTRRLLGHLGRMNMSYVCAGHGR